MYVFCLKLNIFAHVVRFNSSYHVVLTELITDSNKTMQLCRRQSTVVWEKVVGNIMKNCDKKVSSWQATDENILMPKI